MINPRLADEHIVGYSQRAESTRLTEREEGESGRERERGKGAWFQPSAINAFFTADLQRSRHERVALDSGKADGGNVLTGKIGGNGDNNLEMKEFSPDKSLLRKLYHPGLVPVISPSYSSSHSSFNYL